MRASTLSAALLAALLVIGTAQGRSLEQDGGGGLADWAVAEEKSGKPGYWETWKKEGAAPAPAPAPAAPVEDPTIILHAVGPYTLAEVKKHNNRDSAWIAVAGKVYDVTEWVDIHPGGPTAILSVAGTDATKKFSQQHGLDSFQSEMLVDFYVGELKADGAAKKDPKDAKAPKKPKGKGKKKPTKKKPAKKAL